MKYTRQHLQDEVEVVNAHMDDIGATSRYVATQEDGEAALYIIAPSQAEGHRIATKLSAGTPRQCQNHLMRDAFFTLVTHINRSSATKVDK